MLCEVAVARLAKHPAFAIHPVWIRRSAGRVQLCSLPFCTRQPGECHRRQASCHRTTFQSEDVFVGLLAGAGSTARGWNDARGLRAAR